MTAVEDYDEGLLKQYKKHGEEGDKYRNFIEAYFALKSDTDADFEDTESLITVIPRFLFEPDAYHSRAILLF